MSGPLNGLLVADFSRILAGPLASMLLADLGADVIKVERPEHGDDTRAWGPPYGPDGETTTYFLAVNRNKRSVVLDLKDGDDQEMARRLATRADVVIENFRSETTAGFGLDYVTLAADNRGLVYCHISGFGERAGHDLPGYDFLAQAMSGLMDITGMPDGPPIKTGVAIVDVVTGLHAVIGVLAALSHRDRTGEGQRVDVNLMSSALSLLANQSSSYVAGGTVPSRMGNSHPSIAPYDLYPTEDDPIVVNAGNDRQFSQLCMALGRPALAADPRFASNEARVENREELNKVIADALSHHGRDHWLRQLRARSIPCGPINDISEAFALAERLGLDAIRKFEAGDHTVRTVSNPIGLSATPPSYRFPPPTLGNLDASALEARIRRVAGSMGDASQPPRKPNR